MPRSPPRTPRKTPTKPYNFPQYVRTVGNMINKGYAAYEKGKKLYQFGKKVQKVLSPTQTQTVTKKGRKRRARIGGESLAGGKVVADRGKQYYLKDYEMKGAVLSIHTGSTHSGSSGARPVFLLHSTAAYYSQLKIAMCAILKKLFMKAGLSIGRYDQTFQLAGLQSTNIETNIWYRSTTNNTGWLAHTQLLTSGNKIMDLAILWADWLCGLTGDTDYQFATIMLKIYTAGNPGTAVKEVQLDLSNCKLYFNCKSHLKIQNRTTSEANDNIDVVDRHPLAGRVYTAKGSYITDKVSFAQNRTQPADTLQPVFVASETTGVCEGNISNAGNNAYHDIPSPSTLKGVKSYGKMVLNPGQVKTHSISSVFKVSANAFFKQAAQVNVSGISNARGVSSNPHGDSALVALEKLVNEIAIGVAPTIAYDHELRIACIAESKYQNFTDVYTEQYYD